jgi:ABC-type antimicrobial peptide transport system permease subunit
VYDNASGWEWENKDPGINPLVTYFYSDVDFPATFGVGLTQGRFYRPEQQGTTSLSTREIVINQTLARIIGADNPVGLRMSNYGYDFTVIGVIEDFHFKPLTRAVEPLMLFHNRLDETASPQKYNYLFARIRPDNVSASLAHIEKVYKKFNPEFPFAPRFFDEAYDQLYAGAQHAGLIVRYAAGVAIFISCLGLFGLAAYITEQRTKEIGIRKVLGASVPRIVGILSREFLIRVAIANVIGGVISFMLMYGWLQDFAYRTAIGWQPFAIAVLITLLTALLSVSYQAIKAAVANPTETLRHE